MPAYVAKMMPGRPGEEGSPLPKAWMQISPTRNKSQTFVLACSAEYMKETERQGFQSKFSGGGGKKDYAEVQPEEIPHGLPKSQHFASVGRLHWDSCQSKAQNTLLNSTEQSEAY